MSREELLGLAARVEAAERADRLLDVVIADAVDARCAKTNATVSEMRSWSRLNTDDEIAKSALIALPNYTASIDAALSLVPSPAEYPGSKTFLIDCATQTSVHSMPVAYVWNEHGKHMGKARTPALALVAATLRSRAMGEG